MTQEVYLLTKNKDKLLAAKNTFSKYGIDLKQIDKEFVEIQADSSLEIARYSAIEAAKEFKVPVIREDHSLFLNALGFPGPYTKFIESKLPAEKLMLILKEDREGYFEIATVYAEPNGFTKEFVFIVPIKVSNEIKGQRGNWDRVLMLKNSDKTFAECEIEENIDVWNKNFVKIAEFLASRQ